MGAKSGQKLRQMNLGPNRKSLIKLDVECSEMDCLGGSELLITREMQMERDLLETSLRTFRSAPFHIDGLPGWVCVGPRDSLSHFAFCSSDPCCASQASCAVGSREL